MDYVSQHQTDKRCNTLMLLDDQEISNFIMKKNISFYLPETKAVDFTDPVEAFEAIPQVSPDIIFLDLALPMIEEGWKFLNKMYKEGYTEKVVILTSSVSDKDYERAREYPNVVSFVSKPLFGRELRSLCEKVMTGHDDFVKHSA